MYADFVLESIHIHKCIKFSHNTLKKDYLMCRLPTEYPIALNNLL